MTFICGDLLTEDRLIVRTENHMPELLSPETIARGYLVDTIPDSETIIGKDAVLYFNPLNGELWHEYVDRILTDAEEIQNLKQENIGLVQQVNDLTLAMAAIMGGA